MMEFEKIAKAHDDIVDELDAVKRELFDLRSCMARYEANAKAFARAADTEKAERIEWQRRHNAERTCSTCGGDPKSHPSGKPCVCKDGTRQGEVDGLRDLVFDRGKQIDALEERVKKLRAALVAARLKQGVFDADQITAQNKLIDDALEADEMDEAWTGIQTCPKKAEHDAQDRYEGCPECGLGK